MHEMSLMASMLEIIEDRAREDGFHQVLRVHLEIGRLSGVEPEAMRFAFDVSTAGTVAAGAELVIQETEGRGRCCACGREAVLEAFYDPCAACGEVPMEMLSGRDMRILSLDVE